MMKELAQVYHVNIVQYYDWMYRHEKILPDEGDEWVDMFGHTLSRQTIQQRIDAGHAYNQKAMAYQMSYMAREGYTENGVDPKWGCIPAKRIIISITILLTTAQFLELISIYSRWKESPRRCS